MRPDYEREITFALLALAIVIALIVTLFVQRSLHRSEVESLNEEIVRLSSVPVVEEPRGGAEVDVPEIPASSAEYRFPVAPEDYLTFTSPYGYRVSPILNIERYHQGVDIAATWRAQVVAVADGTVVEHWPVPGTRHPSGALYRGHEVFGGMVMIEHANGWRSLYAHLSASRVTTGQRVEAGQAIGRVGSTGQSRGAHLHFELIDAVGRHVNPLLYVRIDAN